MQWQWSRLKHDKVERELAHHPVNPVNRYQIACARPNSVTVACSSDGTASVWSGGQPRVNNVVQR
jgi:hypothetical protein